MITIEEVKDYCRLDADDTILTKLMSSATSYLSSKGIDLENLQSDFDKATYDITMLMYILHRYDNRGVVTDENLREIPLGIRENIRLLSRKCQIYLNSLEV